MVTPPPIRAVVAAAAAAAAVAAPGCRDEPVRASVASASAPLSRPPSTPSPRWLPTARGLVLEPLASGHGAGHPAPEDHVRLWVRGWGRGALPFIDVTGPKAPLHLAVGEAFPGLAEALGLMLEGMRARIWVPGSLAGPGQPAHPAEALVLDLELLQVLRAQPTSGP